MIGGGVIGVEYATIFSALDVPVTLIEARNTILDFVDREIVDDFIHQMRDRGMHDPAGQRGEGDRGQRAARAEVTLADGRPMRAEIVLYAAGRSGNVGSLGLDAVGIEADERGRIKVDPQTFQTTVPHIYAAGDVIGFPSLASTSMEQGRVAACHAFGVHAAAAAGDLSLRHLFGAGDLDRRPVGGAGARERHRPTRSAWRGSARPRAATSWASIPAS